MAYYVNGQRIPEAVSCPEIYGCSDGMTREEQIAQFLKEDLPQMCDKHVLKDSAVINLSVSLYYGLDAAFTERNVSKSLLLSSQSEGVTYRRRLYVSHNYLAQRKNGKWIINPLLMQDEWLAQDKVHQALTRIVRVKKWAKSIEKPMLCDCLIEGIRTVVWGARVHEDDYLHTLVCLPQNGLILIDRSEDEFPIWDEKMIKVADCCFRPTLDHGEIVSLTKCK